MKWSMSRICFKILEGKNLRGIDETRAENWWLFQKNDEYLSVVQPFALHFLKISLTKNFLKSSAQLENS